MHAGNVRHAFMIPCVIVFIIIHASAIYIAIILTNSINVIMCMYTQYRPPPNRLQSYTKMATAIFLCTTLHAK